MRVTSRWVPSVRVSRAKRKNKANVPPISTPLAYCWSELLANLQLPEALKRPFEFADPAELDLPGDFDVKSIL